MPVLHAYYNYTYLHRKLYFWVNLKKKSNFLLQYKFSVVKTENLPKYYQN